MHAQKVIVIHPGSLNLRLGRASDLNPVTILHAIGRRRKQENGSKNYFDPLLPTIISTEDNNGNDVMQEFEENRLHVSHLMQSHGLSPQEERAAKRQRIATPTQQIATFNRRSVPEEIDIGDEIKSENVKKLEDIEIFDEDIIKLTSNSEYNVHFPMRRGELNVHCNIGGSLTSIVKDLESIWSYAIHDRMGIARGSLTQYGAVLVISDIYNRSFLRELVTLILQRLGFRACFLLQDHVAATFGAGLGYACVVDVGDNKCSISCVEDGISNPETRVRLGYGSGDISQVLLALLRKSCFPYKECNVAVSYSDAEMIMHLKEKYCHLNMEICGAQEKSFEVRKSSKILRYTFQLGDECVIAPLALFNTELFNITGKQRIVRLQLNSCQQSDPEDCFDAEYIRETGRVRNGRGDQLLEGSMPVTGETIEDELVVVDAFDVVDDRSLNHRNTDKDEQLYYFQSNGQIVSLDLAVVRSIERCSSDDMKRKMLGCILLVGGGSKISGLAKWLEQKIYMQLAANQQMAQMHQQLPLEVNVCVKEMDATMIAWKGAAIMSCLESSPELWLFSEEWNKHGIRVLREKAIFNW